MVIGLLSAPVCPSASVKVKPKEEVIANIKEAIKGYVAALEGDKLPVPVDHFDALLVAV
jgi:hypothetical protein